ncbi:MAG: Do family serine endopeptidase [Ignavibacteriales bacterium]|nr:Do family serine endopeptidase [Ignavibacteriales bacterium]
MKNKNMFGAIALIVIGIVFGAVLVSGFGWVRPSLADITIGAKKPPVTDVDASAFSKAFIEVAEKVTPSIVRINVKSKTDKNPHDDFFFPFFKDMIPKEQLGSGSGVIITEDGYILTNNHVVEDASKIQVQLLDQRNLDATVVGTDPQTDLAVIKIDASGLPSAYLGNSDDAKVGQWVMAIGNPYALNSTVTAGIISAKGRNIGILKGVSSIEAFIQTDAAINPGNSGGALVDLTGAVVGINSAIASGGTGSYIGYGFAIPINIAKTVAKEIIANGKVNRGYIGVNITPVDAALAKAVGLDRAKGIMVQGLLEKGSAEKAGIKEGDIILKIDGKEVNQPNELQSYVASKTAGTSVNLTLWRDNKEIEKSVTLKARDVDENVKTVKNNEVEGNFKKGSSNTLTFDSIGLTVSDLSEADKETYKVENGILITDVQTLSRASDQALGQGLVIISVDKKKIDSVDEFDNIIKNKKGKAILLKVVDAKGTSRLVGLDLPK